MAKKINSYSKFKEQDIRDLKIQTVIRQHFNEVTFSEPSDWLKDTLKKNLRIPVLTEKAKSELIVTPILTELHERNENTFTCFSGMTLDVDKERGLKGRCDFLLSRNPDAAFVEAPIFSIIEAKNDGIEEAYPQCIAQLYASDLFNKNYNTTFPFIYGAVTTGFNWKFIKYENQVAYIDTDMYYMENLSELLGVLQTIINFYK